MRLLDKLFLFLAGLSLFVIFIIFFSVESHPGFAHAPALPARPESSDMEVYSEDVDRVIDRYYASMDTARAEETDRLVESESVTEELPASPKADSPGASQQAYFFLTPHRVKNGESLWQLARHYQVDMQSIVSANPQKATRMIFPGETLQIPNRNGFFHRVKKGESLGKIASLYKVQLADLKKANPLNRRILPGDQLFIAGGKLPRSRLVEKKMFIWPVAGAITSHFGLRIHPISGKEQFHYGLDISAGMGTPIRAAANGVVIFAGNGGSYGQLVIVRHKEGYHSIYAHCSRLLVKEGTYVRQGALLARVGDTGQATGAHLHFEIKQAGQRLDPMKAFQKKIKVPAQAG